MAVVQVKLPDIGEGIAEGEIQKWLVKEGDTVKRFQPIVEVLTAKATVEIPSPYSGRVVRILASEGETVRVGQPIIEIETSDASPKTVEEAAEKSVEAEVEHVAEQEPRGKPVQRVRAPPSVRLLARRLGVDLSKVKGTGPRGIITKRDVLAYAEQAKSVEETVVEEERIPLKGIKKIMAERMKLAKTTIPHAYVVEEVDVTELLEVREKLKKLGPRFDQLE